jgi:hypothetical protein
MIKFSKILFFFFLGIYFTANAQFLEDENAKQIVLKGIDHIYNFEFEKAEKVFAPIKSQYSSHPVVHLLAALQLQNQYIPIDNFPIQYKKFLSELSLCKEKAKVIHKTQKYKAETTFFLLAAEGLLALAHNYRKEYVELGVVANRAYGYFLDSQKIKNQSVEFLFSSGLYNFYREQYPESHPKTKSIFYFFAKGNKKLGIQELEYSSKNSIFSRVEAQIYLIHILIKYESNFTRALFHASNLFAKYPVNTTFLITQIECLLMNKEYEKAEKLNVALSKKTDVVSRLSHFAFEGYLDEYYRNDLAAAKTNYAKALKLPYEDRYTKDYHAMAYLGIGNIFVKEKNMSLAKTFYKQSLEIAEYKWIIEKANIALKAIK